MNSVLNTIDLHKIVTKHLVSDPCVSALGLQIKNEDGL